MYIVASDSRRISFDYLDWLPKKMQDSRSEWRQIFPTRPYICRPRAAGLPQRSHTGHSVIPCQLT